MNQIQIKIPVLLAILASLLFVSAPAPAQPPNILFIVSDDQGWNDIGYHNDNLRTPNLDQLAETGVRLEHHYVQPQCTPTRVALMTGRYPSRFGPHCTTASNDQSYPIGTPTLASLLKSSGYDTGLFGKWHMGSKPEWGPNHYGFDFSYGSLAGAVGMYDHRYRLNTPYAQTWHRNHEFIEEVGHATDLVTQEAVAWIEKDRDKPFFAYVPFHSVHTPLVEELKWIAMNNHIDHPDRRLYAAALSHLDWAVGQLVEAVDRIGQRENTLIIFTSDNGGMADHYRGGNYPPPDTPLNKFASNDPLKGWKGQVYEGGMRVPAWVNWKGRLGSGLCDSPMHAVDWLPTLAPISGYEIDDGMSFDGIDVWPLITGEDDNPSERILYWVWGKGRDTERVALRKGPWKLLRDGAEGEWELYNLDSDPNELMDLAKKRPDLIQSLKFTLEEEISKDAS
ncbi:MAG: arylsulfatase [Candidatus Omnitrophica bacterium]|nr:arylsulfatase [Candidatus Omnitrophota bacterium]